ncbi:MAG: 5'/3'-nucleotidase SurE [Oscillatoriales cyanobacterium]|jgi:5'-nucleotidase|nr:MAG: 5'/3'-nucleotidase SurE [Oscillatoriales cyanobacterium]
MTARLLIGNDDGIFAPGVRALANAMAIAGYEVTVVCPDRERSATGHSLTMHEPIRANPVEGVFHPKVTAWSCSGTPSDCIKLALGALLDQFPDFVLAGINQGGNTGTDILYSGTVSAAMEGTIEGIPSIALSLAHYTSPDFTAASAFATRLLSQLVGQTLPESFLLNVNIPGVPADQIAGVKLARQGIRRYSDVFQERIDPRGKNYYWLAGEVLTDVDDGRESDELHTDVWAIEHNYISLTPLRFELTSYGEVEQMRGWQWVEDLTRS